MKNWIWSPIIGISFVLGVYIASNAFVHRFKDSQVIHVKGMSQKNFTSDLIVWQAKFSRIAPSLQEAYRFIAQDRGIVKKYLISKGINEKEITFQAVNVQEKYHNYYDKDDNYHRVFDGYSLTQTFKVQSSDVEKVENISREISELIDRGIYLISEKPKYYYTKLDQLKIEMIAKATENARIRAEQIAKNSGSRLGKLKKAYLGVFQITGQYSDEDYTWGGVFNTSSKEKTATVTLTADFEIR